MTKQILLCIPVLLSCVLAVPKSSTEVRSSGGVIYNEAAFDPDTVGWTLYAPVPTLFPRLTFEIRLDTVRGTRDGKWIPGASRHLNEWTEWHLYVTRTIGDTVRTFLVGKLTLIEEVR